MSNTPPSVRDRYALDDWEALGFHDCYVYGVRWDYEEFSLCLDLDYIVKWIEPQPDEQSYRFWVCSAELQFNDVSDAQMDIDWRGWAPECQINEIRRAESRKTPNGFTEWHWELDLAKPEGRISLWATGFDLKLRKPPILSNTQYISKGR